MHTYTKEELATILKRHSEWLGDHTKGERADLAEADLAEADLTDADLAEADLTGANLTRANLTRANLAGADLAEADLTGANLTRANLTRANLTDAYLTRANLAGAYLAGANLTETKGLSSFVICAEGDLIGYKALQNKLLARILIPRKARRVNALGSRKCRAEYVKVLSIETIEGKKVKEGQSRHDPRFRYVAGKIVKPASFDEDVRVECSSGIHFFLTNEEAIQWLDI